MYSGKSGCIWARGDVFRQSICIREKMVVFGQKWLYSGKSGCICAKVFVFGQKWLNLGNSGCIRTKYLYSGKMIVFGQKLL